MVSHLAFVLLLYLQWADQASEATIAAWVTAFVTIPQILAAIALSKRHYHSIRMINDGL